MGFVKALALLLRAWFVPRADLVIENLALRHQLTAGEPIRQKSAAASS